MMLRTGIFLLLCSIFALAHSSIASANQYLYKQHGEYQLSNGLHNVPLSGKIVATDRTDSNYQLYGDPLFSKQWALQNTGKQYPSFNGGIKGKRDADIDAPSFWGSAKPVNVAVVDSGIDVTHPDLSSRLWVNSAESVNGIDDDGNGYVDDLNGYNFFADNNSLTDSVGHGTGVSGVIVAAHNSQGIKGALRNGRVMMLKVANTMSVSQNAINEAALYAVENDARVVNMSFGGSGESAILKQLILDNPQTLFVAAAGNDGERINNNSFPCTTNAANVLCVGASNAKDALSSFSNYSGNYVDVLAPGDGIVAPAPGGYSYVSGTSIATPYVSATAALLLSKHPSLTGAQAKSLIVRSSEKKRKYGDKVFAGRLNQRLALQLAN